MSQPNHDLHIGVIGCGLIAETQHLPVLSSLPGVRVVAAADRNVSRLEQISDRFRISQRYEDYASLLGDRAIDAVVISVPVRLHREVALAAIQADKHIFIEKPLAYSLDECQQIAECAAQSARQFMVGFNLRWHRLVRRAREIIRSGALGRIEAVRTVFASGTRYRRDAPEWRKRRALGGGALIEVGIHHYDLWRFLLGSEVQEIFVASRSSEWDDETATVSARMTDGTLVSTLLTVASCNDNQIDLYGQNGVLRVSLYRFDGLEFLPSGFPSGAPRLRVGRMAQVLRELASAWPVIARGGDMVLAYREQLVHWTNAVRGGTPVACTVKDGTSAQQIVVAALDSANCGRSVQVQR